jgi:hypothetical protein
MATGGGFDFGGKIRDQTPRPQIPSGADIGERGVRGTPKRYVLSLPRSLCPDVQARRLRISRIESDRGWLLRVAEDGVRKAGTIPRRG